MLEGIEILNQIEIMKTPKWIILMFSISSIMTIILMLITISKQNDILATLVIVSFISIVVSVILSMFIGVPTGKYEYQVTIDDNVSMNEFTEKYEILDIEGKIYTIKEKE